MSVNILSNSGLCLNVGISPSWEAFHFLTSQINIATQGAWPCFMIISWSSVFSKLNLSAKATSSGQAEPNLRSKCLTPVSFASMIAESFLKERIYPNIPYCRTTIIGKLWGAAIELKVMAYYTVTSQATTSQQLVIMLLQVLMNSSTAMTSPSPLTSGFISIIISATT